MAERVSGRHSVLMIWGSRRHATPENTQAASSHEGSPVQSGLPDHRKPASEAGFRFERSPLECSLVCPQPSALPRLRSSPNSK